MRRTTTAGALFGALLALCLTLGLVPAFAEDEAPAKGERGVSVGLRPATEKGGDASRTQFEYEVPPKGRIVDHVAVSNLRNEPVKVRLFAKDATTTTDSAFAVQASDESPVDIGSWMSLKEDTITLPPRSETIVPFQLGVPFNATPGDHTGAIVVSLLAKEAKPEGGTVVVDHRVGLRVLLRVPGDYRARLEVADVKATWATPGTVLGRGGAVVSYTVRNTGNLRVKATGEISLDRVLGLPSVAAPTKPIAEIQPGGEIKVRQVIPSVLGTGPMKAEVRLSPLPVDPDLKDIPVQDVTASASFAAWPWLLIALVLGLLLLIIGGTRFERRRRRASRAAMAPTGGSHRAPVVADAPASSKHALVQRAAVAVAAGVLSVGLVPAPASAEELPAWQAVSNLEQGTDNTPFDVITTGGCPLPGTNVVGFAFGNGFPEEGGVVIGNGDAGVSASGPFAMPLSSSMQQLVAMQPDPEPLSGTYKIELRCVTPGMERTTGRYVFAIKFLDAKRWKALPPLTTTKGPNLTGNDEPRTSTDPQDGGRTAPGAGTSGTPGAPVTPSEEEQRAAAARAAELAGIAESEPGSTGGVSWPLVGGGAAVLLATGLYLFRRRTT